MEPADLVDATVVGAGFDPGRRVLSVTVEGGRTIRYERVVALGVTLGARMAAAEWVQDNLPQTLLTEHQRDLTRAESGRGLQWLAGDGAAFETAPVRDSLAFTGGRWFRLFVGAVSRRVEA